MESSRNRFRIFDFELIDKDQAIVQLDDEEQCGVMKEKIGKEIPQDDLNPHQLVTNIVNLITLRGKIIDSNHKFSPYSALKLELLQDKLEIKTGTDTLISPIDLYLKIVKNMLERNGVGKKNRLALAFPDNFDNEIRQLIRKTLLDWGYNLIITHSESLFSLYAYNLFLPSEDQKLALYLDIGNSLNMSLFLTEKGGFYKDHAYRNDELGGEAITLVLMEYCNELFKTKHKYSIQENPLSVLKLRNACEQVKAKLSEQESFQLYIPQLYNNIDLDIAFTRDLFEELTKSIINRIIEEIYFRLITMESVDYIIICGKSTKIPVLNGIIRKLIEKEQATAKICDWIEHPVEFGGSICGCISNDHNILMNDLTCCNYGIANEKGEMVIIVPRSTVMPYSKTQVVSIPLKGNETSLTFGIYEGNRNLVKDCEKIGTVTLAIPNDYQDSNFEVEFIFECLFSQNLSLIVTAHSVTFGTEDSLITHPRRLEPEEIEALIQMTSNQTCVHNQQHCSAFAGYSCFGYSSSNLSVCGGHGICQQNNNCFCLDITNGSALFSEGGSNTLAEEHSLFSPNGKYELKQQSDGNLVLYKPGDPYWALDSYFPTYWGPYSLVLQSDGTLEIRGPGGVLWTISYADEYPDSGPFRLVVQNDGNLVLYGSNKKVCWTADSHFGDSLAYNWGGDECNQYLCYGKVNSGGACNSNGTCVARDSCSCNSGYSGDECTKYYCNDILFSQIGTVCSGKGTCIGPNSCKCQSGYSGSYCELFYCYGLAPNDTKVCSGFGNCSAPDTCSNCQAGRYGSECQYYDCGGIRFDQPNVCSGVGSCRSKNNCTCPELYFGDNCENFMCNGLTHNSPLVCSGRGSCSSPENCTCQEGYFGADCELFKCNGILRNETNVCTGFGNCTAFDTCQCDEQHTGKLCEINICNGVLSTSPSICSYHGQCNSFNNCTCDENYSGQNCENYKCYGAYRNSPTICSGRGRCSAYNNCTCVTPFYGTDCGLYDCFGIEHFNTSTCSSHGSCYSPDNCTCQLGYYGKTCEIHNCYGIKFNDSTVCSGKGKCKSPDFCSCVEGFDDKDCSVNINPFQINISKYEEVVYLEFDNKNVSVDIQLIDPVLSQSPNISYTWTCAQCDGQNIVYYVKSNRLFINSTLTDITQAGNYTFIANASIANIKPFESRKSNLQQFKLVVKYELNEPTLKSFGLPSVLVSGTQDQTISTVINGVTLNQTTVRYFLGCGRNCSILVSYSWEVKAGVFSYKKVGSILAKYDNDNELSFSPLVPIQATVPSQYLNETVFFTFTVFNGRQQKIRVTVPITIISSASPPTHVSTLINVSPTHGITMNDKFTIQIYEWIATSSELLPLKYALGYYDKTKAENVRLTEYSLNTTFSSYLPYIRSSSSSTTKSRSNLETTETIALVLFVKDALGNVETEILANVIVSPFNGTQEQYIEVVKSLSAESLLVASVDQTFTTSSSSSSLVSALISNVVIDPKNPSSSLSSLELLTANNETLTSATVSQVINKVDLFVSNLTDIYLRELELYGYVKSALSSDDITKTVQIISNCFSTSYDSEKTKVTASLVSKLIYYSIIPTVVSATLADLPTNSYKSTLINITVSSFNVPTPTNILHSVSDSESKVSMNLTSIISKYDAYSMTCGVSMIVYSKNTNYDATISNLTQSSFVTDFKFMKKVDVLVLENLDSPLLLSFNAATLPSSAVFNSTITNSTYHCKYWDEKLKMWSSYGCSLYRVSSNSIDCACSHTTMFTTFLESKTTVLIPKDQVSSLYYAQISFGIIYLIVASAILIGLIVLRKSQPIRSRLLTPYVGLIALIVECALIYIVQRSVLVDELNSANSQMWETGDTAANIIANIVMIIVNSLNLTAIFCYVLQVFRFQFMKLLYTKLSENRTQVKSSNILKALKYATSQALFYSLVGIFAALNVVYWVIWVILRRIEVLDSSQYTYIVSVSYTVCIFTFGVIITAVAILDLILSSKKEFDIKKNRKGANISQPVSTFSLNNAENTHEKKINILSAPFNWFSSMDGPLYFRMEMFIYILSFILLILNQIIGLSTFSYRFESLSKFKVALTIDSISFIFEVLYIISYILVFGGYALIVAILHKFRQSRTRKEEQKKQYYESMNQELYNTLESAEGYELFANFCEKEFTSENLFLFTDIKASPDVASGENLGGLLFFAEKIYNKYIKTGAEMEINISSKCRIAFIQLYEKCKKLETSNSTTTFELLDSNSIAKSGIENNAVKDCFELMMRQVVINLGDTFSRFVFTPDYINFLRPSRDTQLPKIYHILNN